MKGTTEMEKITAASKAGLENETECALGRYANPNFLNRDCAGFTGQTGECADQDMSHQVYFPEDDTYLLLEASLSEIRKGDRVIEIGCGRAIIATSLSDKAYSVIASDINPYAVKLAAMKGLQAIRADLFLGISGRFDLIVFNPPYLPTAPEEKAEGWINLALDGGLTGRDTIDRFLSSLPAHLSTDGRCLMLISSQTGECEVMQRASLLGLCAKRIIEKRVFFESLYVIRFTLGLQYPLGG
jgi:release factor glutamine methyltransferase